MDYLKLELELNVASECRHLIDDDVFMSVSVTGVSVKITIKGISHHLTVEDCFPAIHIIDCRIEAEKRHNCPYDLRHFI